MGGYDKPVATMLSPVHVGYSEGFKGPVYDPNKAKALLKEVGAPATGTFTLFTSPVFDQRIVVAIQQMLRGVGLKVEITSSDFGNWLSGLGGGGHRGAGFDQRPRGLLGRSNWHHDRDEIRRRSRDRGGVARTEAGAAL